MPNPFTVFTGTDKTLLTSALLAQNSGVSINASSVVLNASGSNAVNYYDGSLTPLGIGSGLLLTSGITPGTTNTMGWFGEGNGFMNWNYNGDADINAVVNTVFSTISYDATTLAFDFIVSDPAATSVSFDLVFGSEEYPEWVDQFVDCAIVMVNGVNYALFNHDPLHPLSVVSSNIAAGYFQNNAVDPATGLSPLPIEYDGVSHVLKIVAPIISGGGTNHIKIGIADTGDAIYDSGIFISNFSAGNIPGSGIVATPPGACTDISDSVTGSIQDEYFDLKGGDDTVYAGGGDDIVAAGSGNDAVYGGSGNDELKGDGGDDLLDGGAGSADIADYAGASTGYGVAYNATVNSYTITDSNSGPGSEGADTLTNVEYVKFADGLFELGVNGLTSVPPPGTPPPVPSPETPPPVIIPGIPPPPVNTPGMLAINGVGSVGNILTAILSDPDGTSGSISYQWQISSDKGASWSDISGAVNNTYQLLTSDGDKFIQVTASYTDNDSQAEAPVSVSKEIFAPAVGDLTVTLMKLDAPPGASIINPLTTLLNNAIELGLSPNEAAINLKTVLGIPTEIQLQSYDAYAVLQSFPNDPTALAVEKVAVQVAILTSLSDDDTGVNLSLSIFNAAVNNQTLDLSNLDDICFILGIDPNGDIPDSVGLIFDRNKSMSDALADGGDVTNIENEWVDLCGINDGINSTSISDLSIHINQAPVGSASSVLPAAFQNEVYVISSLDLLQGFTDPDGGVLEVSALSADTGGELQDNGDGTWSFIPIPDYSGPVELTYTIVDGQGGSTTVSQLFIVAGVSSGNNTNNMPTGEVVIVGEFSQDQTLFADVSTLEDADGLGQISYQWQADGVDIVGATESNYTLSQTEVGSSITVTASYTDGQGAQEVVYSSPTDAVTNVDDLATGTLDVTGSAEEGGSLVASLSDVVDPDGSTSISYQWQENVGDSWINLAAENSTTLDIPSDQSYVGRVVRVVATTIDALGGITEFIGDSLTIANVNDDPTGTVLITGTAQDGQTLTAANLIADADGLGIISYQWQSDGIDISGAVGSSYTLTLADVGKVMTVTASYTDGEGTYESLISEATAVVTALPGLTLTGTAGADVLNGGAGSDTLYGLAGNDKLNGYAGNDTLDGGTGLDTLTGGSGDDTYIIDNTGDKVIENAGAGVDLLQVDISSAGGTLTLANNVDNAALVNSVAYNLTGNALANVLTGNVAANVLNGGAGSDTMSGGAGNDAYYVDNVGDVVIEVADEGSDRVYAYLSYTLGDNVENLSLLGTGNINGTGNIGNNSISGNIGNNVLIGLDGSDTLNGGIGDDTMTGGTGNDSYYVDSVGDVVIELSGEGSDRVFSSLNYVLGENLENLSLQGTGNIDGTGNIGNNSISGNIGNNVLIGLDGNDTLNGGAGDDTMAGGTGNDSYYVDSIGDVVIELSGEGSDRVFSSLNYVLGENIENLSLQGTGDINGTGNISNNSISGNIGNNVLIGLDGNDTLDGGAGNDSLLGGTGNDVLLGGAGDDTLHGGAGNDSYYVDSIGDLVVEHAGEGTDRVYASLSYTLGDNVENLSLQGTDHISGTGNIANNSITGNIGNNTLNGLDGNDLLDGGAGNDILLGGTGNDTLLGGAGSDLLSGGTGNDIFRYTNESESGITVETMDVISDFTAGQDRLDLTGIDADTAVSGNQAFSSVILGALDPFTSAGQLRFDSAGGVMYGNTDSNPDAEFAIALSGVISISASHILL